MKRDLFTLMHSTADTLRVAPHVIQPSQEAWWLIQNLIGKTQAQLLTCRDVEISSKQIKTLNSLIQRRVHEKEPLQYLLGSTPFCGMEIKTKKPVLIPRPETEEWCNLMIARLRHVSRPLKILDLCTGSGCIALALAKSIPNATVVGVDIDSEAIELAALNKKQLKIDNVEFVHSNLYQSLSNHQFDMIVGNPPYLSPIEWESLPLDIKAWESKKALLGGEDGLEVYRKIIQNAGNFLAKPRSVKLEIRKSPRIALEIGYHQYEDIYDLLEQSGFQQVELLNDMSGKPRVIVAYSHQ